MHSLPGTPAGAIQLLALVLRTGTSSDYARRRVKGHLLRFLRRYEMLFAGKAEENWIARAGSLDNLFPQIEWRYWA